MKTRTFLSGSTPSGEVRRRPRRRGVLPAVVFFLFSSGAFAQEELPQAAAEGRRIPLSVYVDGTRQGDVPGDPETVPVVVDRKEMLNFLAARLDDSVAAALRGDGGGDGAGRFLSLTELEKTGLEADFDPSLLEIRIRIPPELRALSYVKVLEKSRLSPEAAEKPAVFGAYANFYGRGEVALQRTEDASVTDEYPASLLFQQSANYRSWVVESETYLETSKDRAELDYVRLVKDFPDRSLRLNAGSLLLPTSGFQTHRNLAGLGIARDSAYTFRSAEGMAAEQEIVLRSPADVTVYINNRVVKHVKLPAGRHRLGDFPFLTGLNALRIEIKEEGAPPRTITLSVPFDSGLLDEKDYSYAVSLGAPQWSAETPVLLAYGRLGVTEVLSLGLNGQAGWTRSLYGLETLWAGPAGSLKAELGLSFADGGKEKDYGGRLQYRLTFADTPALPVVGAGIQYMGKHFTGPGSETVENPYAWLYSAVASQAAPYGLGFNLGWGYRTGRGTTKDSSSGSFSVMKNFGSGTTLSFFLSGETGIVSGISWKGGVTLTISPPGGRSLFNTGNDIVNGTSYADYQVRPEKTVGSPGYSAAVDGLPFRHEKASSLRLGTSYIHDRFEASAANTVYRGPEGNPQLLNRLSLSASSAVAVTEDAWTVSRPISDSFALVVPKNTEGRSVRISSGGGAAVTAGSGEVAAIHDLRSYQARTVTVGIPELPPGKDSGAPERLLMPTYKSGYTLSVGVTSYSYGKGSLRFLDGKPIPLQGGEIVSTDRPESRPFPFFTDEEGSFEFYGFAPGSYELRLYIHEFARMNITVPETEDGFVDLGRLTLPVLRKER